MATPDDRSNGVFVDTNVLVYAFDRSDPSKHTRANEVVGDLIARGDLVISAKVLNEFYHASTRPHRNEPLTHGQAKQIVTDLATGAQVVALDGATSLAAIAAVGKYGLSFWDALIWAAAKSAGCGQIVTEDFQGGQVIDQIEFVNPFA